MKTQVSYRRPLLLAILAVLTYFGVVEHYVVAYIMAFLFVLASTITMAAAVVVARVPAVMYNVAFKSISMGMTSITIFTPLSVGVPLMLLASVCAWYEYNMLAVLYAVLLLCFTMLQQYISKAFDEANVITALITHARARAEQDKNARPES